MGPINPQLSEERPGNAHEPGFGGEAGAALAAVLRSFQGTDPDPSEEALCCKGSSGCIPIACQGCLLPTAAKKPQTREPGSAGSRDVTQGASASCLHGRCREQGHVHSQEPYQRLLEKKPSGSHPDLGPVAGGGCITAPFPAGYQNRIPPPSPAAPCSAPPLAGTTTLTPRTNSLHVQSVNCPAFCP